MIEIRMPQIASDMTEADLLAWLVQPGDQVAAGDLIAEIETDKSTVELESPAAGTLAEILIPAGSMAVKVGELLARLEPVDGAAVLPPQSAADSAPVLEGTEVGEPPTQDAGDQAAATALARRLADQAGIAIESLEGTGAHGRVTKRDVVRRLEGDVAPTADEAPPAYQAPAAYRAPADDEKSAVPDEGTTTEDTTSREIGPRDERVPLSRMRRTIAERLGEAKRNIPHFYLRSEIDAGELLSMRARLGEVSPEPRVSVNDFVIRACALALREVPEANASWDGDALIRHGAVDISVAVATDGGLITPIVRGADRKGLAAISHEMRDLAVRAREGKLTPREYQGGSFSVSNLGMYGIDSVLAIVNPPQSCILGVGAAREKPVVRDGHVIAGRVMALTLSADHRVVDGAVGARLLVAIKRRLEAPLEMLL